MQGIPEVVDFVQLRDGRKVILLKKFPKGETLYRKKREGRLTEHEAVSIMLKVTRIVKALLDEDVYHWDITPDNIYITDEDEVILFDFDIAFRSKKEFKRRGLYILGTLPYMSQRRRSGEKIFSHADEICSIGKILNEMFDFSPPPNFLILLRKELIVRDAKGKLIHGKGRHRTISKFLEDFETIAREHAIGQEGLEERMLASGEGVDVLDMRSNSMVTLRYVAPSEMSEEELRRARDSLKGWETHELNTYKAVLKELNRKIERGLDAPYLDEIRFIVSPHGEVEGYMRLPADYSPPYMRLSTDYSPPRIAAIEVHPQNRSHSRYKGIGTTLFCKGLEELLGQGKNDIIVVAPRDEAKEIIFSPFDVLLTEDSQFNFWLTREVAMEILRQQRAFVEELKERLPFEASKALAKQL